MRELRHDIRRACRALMARPGYVVAATVTLALGIGATTAVFSVLDALMFRPLPFANPDHVVQLQTRMTAPGRESVGPRFSREAWRALQQQTAIFQGVEPLVFGTHVITGGVEPEIVAVTQVTAGMFPMLGVTPQLGRPLSEDDATANQGRVLVISDRLWSERFGRDAQVIGRTIALNDVPYEIVGVMPASLRFPAPSVRAWRPYVAPPSAAGGRPQQLELVARVRGDLPLDQALRDVRALGPAFQQAGLLAPDVAPEFDAIRTINSSERTPMLVLLGAVCVVLAIACANVMNLGLAHGSVRRREFAVCTALGASRARLARQLLLESLIVCVAGGAAGTLLAYAAVDALAPLMPTALTFLSAHPIRVDGRVLLFASLVTMLSALVAGLLPAMRGSRGDVSEALKAGGRSQTASTGARRILGGMAVAQCALAIVLLAGAGLLIKSFIKLQAVDPGFNMENLMVMGVSLRQSGGARYGNAASQLAFFDQLAADVRALPGVRAATIAGGAPPQGGGFRTADLETDAAPGESVAITVPFTAVTPDYFEILGIRLLAGHVFTAADPITTVVIDEVFARRFWGSAHAAVDRRFRMGPDEEWHTVAGVVADVKMMGLDDRIGEGLEYYHPMQRTGSGWGGTYTVVARTAGDPQAIIPAVKQRVWALDAKMPIHDAGDVSRRMAASISRQRFFLILMTLFASIAAVVAAIGIYAVFSYSVAQRTQEIGIRLAFGATSAQVARLLVGEGARLATIGAVFGLAGAWMGSRVLTTLLFQTTPTDPVALAGSAACLVTLALLACYVPARRARQVDPLIMLKVE